ncbi:hypothetical protein [Paracoccus sp. ME4]|uniref:hypothetical protein n=1 Tax=Paracoccus sp. ME4 TaxID=3138066 RepID=UPI00398AC6A1
MSGTSSRPRPRPSRFRASDSTKDFTMQPRKHRISLQEAPGRHMMERHPRYAVLVNGQPRGELYYNMTGYVGTLPMVQGGVMNIGERPISAFRKEVSILNREAQAALDAAEKDPRKIVMTRPTSDNRFVMAFSRHPDEDPGIHLLSRMQFAAARRLFAIENVSEGSFVNARSPIGLGFFSDTDFSGNPQEDPVILLEPGDEWLGPALGSLKFRVMDGQEAMTHCERIERVIETADGETVLVIGAQVSADAEPNPRFVTRSSLRFAQHVFGDEARVGDLVTAPAAAIADPDVRSALEAEFSDLVLDGEADEPRPHDDHSPNF